MSGTTKAEVAQQIIKETTAQADRINNVKHGKVTYIIQHGKVDRLEINESLKTNSPRGGE